MYQAYKDGKIKKEHLLITDLIDIELMMMQEEIELDEKIHYEEENIRNQEIRLAQLLNEKISLEKKI